MSSLPEDIYREILLRLPVKSRFACKSVCKSWRSIISDPDFVKMYLNLNRQIDNYSLIVKSDKGYRMYSSDSLSSSNGSDDAAAFVELETPYKYSRSVRTALLGSCNGLVYGRNYGRYNKTKFFFLWNPATNEYKKLPKSDTIYSPFSGGNYGFGYDYKTGDYKLVYVLQNKTDVYSLKSNSWKSVESNETGVHYNELSGVVLNGSLHWLGGINVLVTDMIVSMDISEERFGKLQLPMALSTNHFQRHYMNMGVLEGYLSVVVRKETFEVWVAQEYGVSGSWTKLYSITFQGCYYVELVGSFKDGEIMFTEHHNVVSYDLKCGTARRITIDNSLYGTGVVKYYESLVSIKSITAAGRKEKKEINRISKKSMTKKRKRGQ